jgi:predicted nuclease of predicted toxin-antitoxin system
VRILANENVPGDTVATLQEQGHDVAWIRLDAPGSSDEEVLERAAAENRLILTMDKDFGELAFRFRLPAEAGIVLLRIRANNPAALTRVAVDGLQTRDDWSGHFSVIENDRVRMTQLPGRKDGAE